MEVLKYLQKSKWSRQKNILLFHETCTARAKVDIYIGEKDSHRNTFATSKGSDGIWSLLRRSMRRFLVIIPVKVFSGLDKRLNV